jgi:signal transduction histidine kinase
VGVLAYEMERTAVAPAEVVVARDGLVVRADSDARIVLAVSPDHAGPLGTWLPEFPVSLWPACGDGAVVSVLRTAPVDATAALEGGAPVQAGLLARGARDLLVEVGPTSGPETALRVSVREGTWVDQRSIDAHFDVVSRFVAELTHELNNPLTGIIAALDTTIEFEELSPSARAMITNARAEVLRVAEIVARARRQTRRGEPEIETVDVQSMLDSVLGPMRAFFERRGVSVRVEVPDGLASIRTDPFRVKAILVNLLVNARDALERRGSELRIRIDRLPEADGTSWLALTVQDDGSGMTRDEMRRAGDLLFTTKRAGSGIGLAMVRSAASLFGGSVLLRSAPGRGTIASVLLREPSAAPRF